VPESRRPTLTSGPLFWPAQTRYIGLTKTRFQHVATTAAIDILRLSAWRQGTPFAQTRRSHFAALQFFR